MIKETKTDAAPLAIGPYSQGTDNGQIVMVSGQLPIDPKTNKFAGNDIISQTRQSLQNVQNILAAAGLTMANVMKSTVYLANMDDFKDMNAVYSEFFQAPFPARAAFQVAKLPLGALVEIEVLASR